MNAGRVVGVLDLQADVAGGELRNREVAADVGDAAGDGDAPGVAPGSNAPPATAGARAPAAAPVVADQTLQPASARSSLISSAGGAVPP